MRKIVLLCLLSVFVSCEGEIPFILTRSDSDPFDSVVKVQPVSEDSKGYFSLSWEEDSGADSYIVMRSKDDVNLDFRKIYSGRNTSFKDEDFESKECYVYRLDKVRGNKIFQGTDYAYGYYYGIDGKILCDDIYENNDSRENAKRLESTVEANVYAVKFNTNGKILYDEDWYYISVPALYTAKISVYQNSREIISGNTDLRIYFSTMTVENKIIVQNDTYSLKNTTSTAQDMYFRITADSETLLGSELSGQILVNYTVRLESISH